MKITPITCIYGRPETNQLWLDHINDLGFKPVICYSKDEDLPDGHFWKVKTKNTPLGAKWQTAVDAAVKIGADYYLILGSDDFVSERYFERFEFSLERSVRRKHKIQFYGVEQFHILNKKRLYHFRYSDSWKFQRGYATLGAGRMYSDRLLKNINPIYDKELESSLDARGEREARKITTGPAFCIEPRDKEFIGVLCPKTEESMHPMVFFDGRTEEIDGKLIYEFFDLDLVQKMTKLPDRKYTGAMGTKLKKARERRGL